MDAMPSRPRRRCAVAVLLLSVLAAAGCTGANAVSQGVSGSNGYQRGDASLVWISPGDRHAAGAVRGQLLDGTAFDLAQWRGKVVVVNFWGSWCGPCRDEAQGLEQVARDERSDGVEFVGIDVRDDRPQAESYVRDHHISYPNVWDPSNLLALQFPGIPPNATPTTLVLDRQGLVAARHSGAILYTQLRAVVRRVVAETS
jgi:thiol-disulfide isomerase/thioredoxin